MTTLICLTKAYNLGDFDTWLSYHLCYIDRIIILDNESEVDVKSACEGRPGVEYHLIKGWPDQWHLFNDILNQKTDIKFEKDEIVAFLDDDEYLLYHTNNITIIDPRLTFVERMNKEKEREPYEHRFAGTAAHFPGTAGGAVRSPSGRRARVYRL